MSAYSTLKVTRQKAREVVMRHLHGEQGDKWLEQVLDTILEPRLYNAIVVDDSEIVNDDEWL